MTTFVLVHGAWHGAWCWFKVIPLLEHCGHTVVALDLPSHGIDRTPTREVSLELYAERICKALDDCPDPVVLVGHSMGGIAISRAAELRPAKVAKLVYVAAFLLRDGQALVELGSPDADAQALPEVVFNEDHTIGVLKADSLRNTFYADCDESDSALAALLLVPQAMAVAATPLCISAKNWGGIPRVYIECLRDNAIPIALQRAMYAALPCRRIVSMNTSHSPFFSAPADLAEHLIEFST